MMMMAFRYPTPEYAFRQGTRFCPLKADMQAANLKRRSSEVITGNQGRPQGRNRSLLRIHPGAPPHAPRFTYLAALLVSITLTFSVHFASRISAIGQMDYIRYSESMSLGRPLSLLAGGIGALLTTLLWLIYRPTGRWNAQFTLFLALVGATWLVAVGLSATQGSPLDASLLGLPLLLAMIWAKPVPIRDVLRAIDFWALSTVGLAAAFIGLQWAGLAVTSDPIYLRRWQIPTPFGTVIERWAGPFGNVNFAGPLGAAILVYGLTRSGMVRLISVAGGLIILILSESRSAIAAAIVGVTVLVVAQAMKRGRLRPLASFGAVGLAAISISGLLLLDPSLNGRTSIWVNYLDAWWDNPIWGLRLQGGLTSSGHNTLIDTALQYGLAGLLPMLGALAVLTFMAFKVARRGPAFVLPLLAVVLVGCSMDRLIDLRYFTLEAVPILAIALGASAYANEATSVHSHLGQSPSPTAYQGPSPTK